MAASNVRKRSQTTTPDWRPGRSAVSKTTKSSPTSGAASAIAQASVDKKDQSSESKAKLRISMDYGTRTLAATFLIVVDQDFSPADVHNVHFSDTDYWAPQLAAWSDDGDFYWGYDISRAVETGTIRLDQRIELWKLLLYKDHATSSISKRVIEQLGRRSLDDLLAIRLGKVIDAIKEYVKRHPQTTAEYSAQDIDDMPLELLLSVPQMWKAPANQRMTAAAKKAGIKRVELVYEPQCAAAFYTWSVRLKRPEHLKAGEVLLIADVGGGTGDFVSYEYRQDSSEGATVGLTVAKPAEGALCGSEWVNENFLEWLQAQAAKTDKKSGFQGMCKQLDLSPAEVLKEANDSFEAHKQKFSAPDARTMYVTIHGSQSAKRDIWDVKIDGKTRVSLFAPVLQKVIKCIDAQLTDKTKTMIIPGGFGRSQYLLDRIRERYNGKLEVLGQASDVVGAYQPVARGAQYRYNDIQDRSLAATDAFGIGQVEEWDEDNSTHRDATYKPGDTMANGRTCRRVQPNRDVVEVDRYHEDIEAVVYERWHPILEKGQYREPGKPIITQVWQYYCVPADSLELTMQIYWTELDMQPGEPILNGANCITGTIRPGIEPWGDLLVYRLPDLQQIGFKKEKSKQGPVYEVFCRLVVTCDGANVKAKMQIAKPGTQPYDGEGRRRRCNVQLTEEQVFEVVEAAYNPNPRGSPS